MCNCLKMWMFLLVVCCLAWQCKPAEVPEKIPERPKISFTFDDGITHGIGSYPFKVWNERLLATLDRAAIKSVFFVTGFNKLDKRGQALLESWNERGHRIGNHTFSHPNYHDSKVGFDDFCYEILKTDTLIRQYSQHIPLFRFPYLKEGKTSERIQELRDFLKANGYRNGHVTIDASDWYIESRLRKRLRQDSLADLEPYRQFYLEHLYDRAMYYDSLALQLTDRQIHHTLLLHHNLSAALFLEDLIELFKERGWEIVDAERAFEDPIFQEQPNHVPAGESLIWALAQAVDSLKTDLRYPAEDSRYEEARMDELGL